MVQVGRIRGDASVSNLDEEAKEYLTKCLQNGGPHNLRAALNYSRRVLDGKPFRSEPVAEPKEFPNDGFFYLGEDDVFASINDYNTFYKQSGRYTENGPKVAIVTSILNRDIAGDIYHSLVGSLEGKGMNAYPIFGFRKRLELVKAVDPDVVVLIPHGRLDSRHGVAYLKEKNVPVLMPQVVFAHYQKWNDSQRGIDGGMLTQNVVMPEVDGAAYPYTIAAQFSNERGLNVFNAIPERVAEFTELVARSVALRTTANADKKIAIFYYKGAGQNAMVAEGLEIAPSLFNLLKRLEAEGYSTGELPVDADALYEQIQAQGVMLGSYAKGAFEDFVTSGQPAIIPVDELRGFMASRLTSGMMADMEREYGPLPGPYMTTQTEHGLAMAVARLTFGNVVLLPVPMAGYGENESTLVHGQKKAPPYPYVAAYLWGLRAFGADAFMHFGTHGSVEFAPWKQNALSASDWPDALLAGVPHFYLYSISNIGEALIAKRRSYSTMITHITPPFTESGLYSELWELHQKLHEYFTIEDGTLKQEYLRSLSQLAAEADLDKDLTLKLDDATGLLTSDAVERLNDYMHELETEKIMRGLHHLGRPYDPKHVDETARLMAVDSLAHSLSEIARLTNGHESAERFHHANAHNDGDVARATMMLNRILSGELSASDLINTDDALHAFVTRAMTEDAHRHVDNEHGGTHSHDAHSHSHGDNAGHTHAAPAEHGHDTPHEHAAKSGHSHGGYGSGELKDEVKSDYQIVFRQLTNALESVEKYRTAVTASPTSEMDAIVNAFNGGYTAPASGGDPIANPDSLPSGRNTYGIDAERTPTSEAWTIGVKLAKQLLETTLADTGDYPKKVAFTLWSSEFVRQEGITIAEIFYLLGVEPVRNARGSVHDVRLIPMSKLNRPRVDVVVQTSGQFRDLGASRIYLINKAVRMAAEANDGGAVNHVYDGVLAAERVMKDKGIAPETARQLRTVRVFGGVNGNYGTAIMAMVENGDSWESEDEIARRYIGNMGAMYDDDNWAQMEVGMFEAAMQNTDTVVQPRSASTWGPLSLDHVYEFMGGISNAARYVTGKEPDAYFSDLRNRNRPIIQRAREAIWVEARTTLLNPKYIRELQQGSASSAEVFAETFRDTYGWDVMKSDAIDETLWDTLHEVYVKDKHNLDLHRFFEDENPYALQEMTAVMLETVRKGYWTPDEQVVREIADLHGRLVKQYKAGCSGFVCDNAKLRELIAQNLSDELRNDYVAAISAARDSASETHTGMEMEKETAQHDPKPVQPATANIGPSLRLLGLIAVVVLVVILGTSIRRKQPLQ